MVHMISREAALRGVQPDSEQAPLGYLDPRLGFVTGFKSCDGYFIWCDIGLLPDSKAYEYAPVGRKAIPWRHYAENGEQPQPLPPILPDFTTIEQYANNRNHQLVAA